MQIKGDKNTLYKSFKVIGVYDSEKYNNTKSIYIPKSTIKEINKELDYEFSEYCMRIVVDNIDNYNSVKDKLVECNLLTVSNIVKEASNNSNSEIEDRKLLYTTDINIETQQIVKKIMYFFAISSVVILITFLVITNISKSYISKEELGILEVEGYKKKEINQITILENIFVCLIGIILALIIYNMLLCLESNLLNYIIQIDSVSISFNKIQEQLFYIKDIPQKISFTFILYFTLIIISIETINTYFINKKILKKSIVDILK